MAFSKRFLDGLNLAAVASAAVFLCGCGDKREPEGLNSNPNGLQTPGQGVVLPSDSVEVYLFKSQKTVFAKTKMLGHVDRVSMPINIRGKGKLNTFSWDPDSETRLTLGENTKDLDAESSPHDLDIVTLEPKSFFSLTSSYNKSLFKKCRDAIENQVQWFDGTQDRRDKKKMKYVNWGNQFGQEHRFVNGNRGAQDGEEYKLISLMEDNLSGPPHGTERWTIDDLVVYMGPDGRQPLLGKVTRVQAGQN